VADIRDSDDDTKSPKKKLSLHQDSPLKFDSSLVKQQTTPANNPKYALGPTTGGRGSCAPFGRSATEKFSNLFKLQKKNLNDEGIQGVDEGLMTNKNSVIHSKA